MLGTAAQHATNENDHRSITHALKHPRSLDTHPTMNHSTSLPSSLLVDLDLLCNSENDVTRIFDEKEQTRGDSTTTMLGTSLVSPFPDAFECDYSSNGITTAKSIPMIETSWTIASLKGYYFEARNQNETEETTQATAGLTLELWMTPNWYNKTHGLRSLPIFTIGRPGNHSSSASSMPEGSIEEEEDFIGCSGYDLLLAQRGDLLEVSYQDDNIAQSCRFLLVPRPLVADLLLQVILILRQGETRIYFNGEPVILGARNSFPVDLLAHWNPNYRIQLFSNNLSLDGDGDGDASYYEHFDGSIHQISVYGEPMTDIQIGQAFQLGLERIQSVATVRPLLLVAAAFDPVILTQGRTDSSSFVIGGWNSSTPGLIVHVEITSLPAYGMLRSIEGPAFSLGHRIPLVGNSTNTPVFYDASSPDFFTVPSSTFSGIDLNLHSEGFAYRLVAVDAKTGSTVLGTSEDVEKRIHVVHVNHPPELQSPNQIRVIQDPVAPTGVRSRPKAQVTGLELLDPDENIDRVRVDIWALNGTVTIQEEYRGLADYTSCADRTFSAWQCLGDGLADRNMTFVAEPDDASLILSNLQYNAFFWNNQDLIVVRIFDGIGGPCLSENEHRTGRLFTTNDNPFEAPETAKLQTIHDGCYQVTANIEIPPMGIPRNQGDGGLESFSGFEEFKAPHIIFWVAVVSALCTICYCIPVCVKCVARRGRRVFPDDLNFVQNFDQYATRHQAEIERV